MPARRQAIRKDSAAHLGFEAKLTSGRYVGAEEVEDDEPFDEKIPQLIAELEAQFAGLAKLEAAIRANLKSRGYGE